MRRTAHGLHRPPGAAWMWPVLLGCACAMLVLGCRGRSGSPTEPAAASAPKAASSAASSAVATAAAQPTVGPAAAPSGSKSFPVPRETIEAVLNPDHAPTYTGPFGAIEGIVHMSGDRAPPIDFPIPASCPRAIEMYETLFREGPERQVADVLVAATGYDGYVPDTGPARRVDVGQCVFQSRTIDATFGQSIEVYNIDTRRPYIPRLLGGRTIADIVAVPRGDPVSLYPTKPGQYGLVDDMAHHWMYADVFVLKFATHSVTGVDGRYRIGRVPVGKVKVSAYLPVTGATSEHEVMVEAGETATVDFTLHFDAKKDTPKTPPGSSVPGRAPLRPTTSAVPEHR